jgi:hypothetical protein
MGLVYDAPIEAVSVSAAQDLWEWLTPSDAAGLLHAVVIEQTASETSEQLRLTVAYVTGAPTSGSGGGTITPTPRVPGAPAAGSTVERNNTTQISGGTSVKIADRGFNILNGIEIIFDPPREVAPSTRIVVALPTAPGAAITVSGVLVMEEVGG